jgi:hypothetical protein
MFPGTTREESQAFHDRLLKMAKDHPDDPLALLLADEALINKDMMERMDSTKAGQ